MRTQAAASGHTDAVDALIRGGADATATNMDGLQAFELAALNKHTETLRRIERLSCSFCNRISVERRFFCKLSYNKDMWLVVRHIHNYTTLLFYDSPSQNEPSLEVASPEIVDVDDASSEERVFFSVRPGATPTMIGGRTWSGAKPVNREIGLRCTANRMVYNVLADVIEQEMELPSAPRGIQTNDSNESVEEYTGNANLAVKVARLREDDLSYIPEDLCCPITREIMIEPVTAADGHTYEKKAIKQWLKRYQKSPQTNKRLAHRHLCPNFLFRSQILEWVEKQLEQRNISIHLEFSDNDDTGEARDITVSSELHPPGGADAIRQSEVSSNDTGSSVAESDSKEANTTGNKGEAEDEVEDACNYHYSRAKAALRVLRGEERASGNDSQNSGEVNGNQRKQAALMSGYASPQGISRLKSKPPRRGGKK